MVFSETFLTLLKNTVSTTVFKFEIAAKEATFTSILYKYACVPSLVWCMI